MNILNPFEVLKIKNDCTFEQIVEELKNKKNELENLMNIYNGLLIDSCKEGILSAPDVEFHIENKSIEEIMNLRTILTLTRDKKYFSEEELTKILNTIKYLVNKKKSIKTEEVDKIQESNELLKGVMDIDSEEISEVLKILNFSRNSQAQKVVENYKIYKDVLQKYESNPNNNEYKQDIIDIYIKDKFEEEVIRLSKRFALFYPEKIQKNSDFLNMLTENLEYKKIRKAYDRIATREQREVLYPKTDLEEKIISREELHSVNNQNAGTVLESEHKKNKVNHLFYFYNGESDDIDRLYNPEYLKSNNINLENLFFVYDKNIEQLLEREVDYKKDWLGNKNKTSSEKYEEGIAENSNHDYSWGIILQNPKFLMKDEEVDTPFFKGHMSIEKIGDFTSYSLFQKRARVREKQKNTNIQKVRKLVCKRLLGSEKQKGKTMKEFFYRYEATKALSDTIYRVTKRDDKGNVRTDIVFSPIGLDDLKDPEKKEFIKNVYFSDYMLNICKANGGYAGRIIRNLNGLTISNKYSTDEVTVAKLFYKGINGKIYDRRGNSSKISYNKTKDDFLRMISKSEREREFNE